MLELEGTPQDIVDFRRQHVPGLIFHACPECGDELDPRQSRDPDQPDAWAFICWECETSFTPALATHVESVLDEKRIVIDPDKPPRNPVPPKPASMDFSRSRPHPQGPRADRCHGDEMTRVVEESVVAGGLMDINDWIDQTLAAKDYIQAQEDREDFILRTGAGATKFNKWMKKAGLFFNKQTGRWTRRRLDEAATMSASPATLTADAEPPATQPPAPVIRFRGPTCWVNAP